MGRLVELFGIGPDDVREDVGLCFRGARGGSLTLGASNVGIERYIVRGAFGNDALPPCPGLARFGVFERTHKAKYNTLGQ